jgi:hypothetical protein
MRLVPRTERPGILRFRNAILDAVALGPVLTQILSRRAPVTGAAAAMPAVLNALCVIVNLSSESATRAQIVGGPWRADLIGALVALPRSRALAGISAQERHTLGVNIAKAVANLAVSDDACTLLVESGALPVLLAALDTAIDSLRATGDPGEAEQVARAFGNLTSSAQNLGAFAVLVDPARGGVGGGVGSVGGGVGSVGGGVGGGAAALAQAPARTLATHLALLPQPPPPKLARNLLAALANLATHAPAAIHVTQVCQAGFVPLVFFFFFFF